MKNLAKKLQVYFVLNPPYSSKTNLIEYVFEVVKRTFRARSAKKKRVGLAKVLRDRMIEIKDIDLKHQKIRYWKFLLHAMYRNAFCVDRN